jgi:hypothetical protein
MARAYASGVVDADADAVWSLARRFDGLPEWHPAVEACEILDGADPAAVGARRRQVLANGGLAEARLVSLDDQARTQCYEMLDGPWPVRSYFATIRVAPITTAGTAFVEWWGIYDADQEVEADLLAAFGVGVYQAGVEALQSWFVDRV